MNTETKPSDERFPFGAVSSPRPPRIPDGGIDVLVLGVYPSAFHVRWKLPRWYCERHPDERPEVANLAVDVEPVVFWDGKDPQVDLVEWASSVGFKSGDAWPSWGEVSSGNGNGPSGRRLLDDTIRPLETLGYDSDRFAYSDVVPRYFVKRSGSPTRRQQGDVIDTVYEQMRQELIEGHADAPPPASLPKRPTPRDLVALAVAEHSYELRNLIGSTHPRAVVTIGEESRAVICELADEAHGAPTHPLAPAAGYGHPGSLSIANQELAWYALVHPGQKSRPWMKAREDWLQALASRAAGDKSWGGTNPPPAG